MAKRRKSCVLPPREIRQVAVFSTKWNRTADGDERSKKTSFWSPAPMLLQYLQTNVAVSFTWPLAKIDLKKAFNPIWPYFSITGKRRCRAMRCQLGALAHRAGVRRLPVSVHMLIFTGHSRKWCWQPRFEVRKGPRVKHFLLTWKHIQAHLALGICRPPPWPSVPT